MDNCNEKFKKGIICSSAVIIAFLVYCLSEMIVSWCIRYTYYYLLGRIVAAVCLFVLSIAFSTQHKKIGIFPTLVCSVLFFAIMVDFFASTKLSIYMASDTDINTFRIYPLVIYFHKCRDLSHPQNSWANEDNLDLAKTYVCTIIFVMAILIGIIILAVSMAVKKSKIDVTKANKITCRISLGLTIFLFVEFMREIFMLVAKF